MSSSRYPKRQRYTRCSLIEKLGTVSTPLAQVRRCIEHDGGDINERWPHPPNPLYTTALHVAAGVSANNDINILKYLISIIPHTRRKAMVNAKDIGGDTPLHDAISYLTNEKMKAAVRPYELDL